MLDFSSLLSGLADEVKRKPHKKPEQLPLPTEVAIDDAIQGGKRALATQAPALPTYDQWQATQQGITDEPANKDNVYGLPQMDEIQRSAVQGDPIVAPRVDRTPKPLTLDDQIAEKQKAAQDAADAPVEKQSWWKDFGAKLVQGADAFFNGNRAPIVGWGRLKHDQAVQAANAKLNPLLAQREQQNKQLKAQQEAEMNTLEYKIKTNKEVRDDIDAFMKSLGIDQKNEVTARDAALLNNRYGSRWTPEYWGKYVRDKVAGVPMIARETGNPNSIVDTSRPKVLSEGEVGVPLSGGGTGYVPSKTAVENDKDERVAGIAAGRQVAIKNAELLSDTQRRNVDRANKYGSDLTEYTNKMSQAFATSGDTNGVNEINELTRQINDANARYVQATVDGNIDDDGIAAYHKTVNEANEKLAKLYDKQKTVFAQQGLKPPPKPKFEKAVQVDMGTKPKKDRLKLF